MKRTSNMTHAAILGLAMIALSSMTGCGIGNSNPAGSQETVNTVLPALGGTIHGGPNPIVNARVVLYTTSSNGYGVASSSFMEANSVDGTAHHDTDAGGSFSFPGGFTCPAGEYVYVAAYGGNTGANVANNNVIEMSAIGSCDSLYSGSTYTGKFIWLNELTTIAAAYTLNNFMTVSGDPVNGFSVGIGAPVTNHATAGCVANSYYPNCTQTAAAGLAHAFANATALVNTSTGVAQTFSQRIMPVDNINTLGNVLQSCVNSTGGGTNAGGAATSTTTSNDGTNCGKLFSFTGYTVGSGVSAVSNIPTNTLQSMMNLAKRPASNGTLWDSTCATAGGGTTTGTNCIYGLAAASGFYTPALAGAPFDWMMGIIYPNGVGGTTTCVGASTNAMGIFSLTGLALDINDSVYVANNGSTAQTCDNVVALNFDGSSIFAAASETAFPKIGGIAVDALGHIAITDSATPYAVRFLDAKSGVESTGNRIIAPGATASISPAFDLANNLWFGTTTAPANTGSVPVINEYALVAGSTNGTFSYTAVSNPNFAFNTVASQGIQQLFIDQNQNIWAGGIASTSPSGNPAMVVIPNTGTAASPAYAASPIVNTTAIGYSANYLAAAVDSNGIAYLITPVATPSTAASTLYQYTPAGTPITALSASTAATNTGLYNPRIAHTDGNSAVWVADFSNGGLTTYTGGLYGYDSKSGASIGYFRGCRPVITNNLCGTSPSTGLIFSPKGFQIDSTGNIWFSANQAGAYITEVLGMAAPTWPQLSLGKFGKP